MTPTGRADVTIVGGGLAGSEAAWQLADLGLRVRLFEMRPATTTGAHRGDRLAEIVCSNSFKSTRIDTASGLLKAEMDRMGCRLLRVARTVAVPAGHALAVDRERFAEAVSAALEAHPNVEIVRETVDTLDLPRPTIVATGPLTGGGLADALRRHNGEHLYFYDAIAPSIDGDTIDTGVVFRASRYGRGGADYWNVPLDREGYLELVRRIREADRVTAHDFENVAYFEACLPIEVLAERGDDTLRFGPLKPRGLVDPRTGREPWAVIQLRRESLTGSLLGMVGFQTRMTFAAQKAIIRSLPGLADVRILRYGTIHRNLFLDMPRIARALLRDRRIEGLRYAGQICGVEGYVESIFSGMVAALATAAELRGETFEAPPPETMTGALLGHIHHHAGPFQPMNANFGILPPLERRVRGRRVRAEAMARRALAAFEAWWREQAPRAGVDPVAGGDAVGGSPGAGIGV